MKLGIVMATFNRPQAVEKHLAILRTQTRLPDGVIIVDSGEAGVGRAVAESSGKFPVTVLKCSDGGPAGSFWLGGRRAYADGYDCILFADDDAYLVGKDALRYFAEDAREGRKAVGAYYVNGRRARLGNHYFMYRRELFTKTGFYFRPFHLMYDDVEFLDRVKQATELFYDERIVVDHPLNVLEDSRRQYYQLRNELLYFSLNGRFQDALWHFVDRCMKMLFVAVALREPAFIVEVAHSLVDFATGRLGKADVRPVTVKTRPADLDEVLKGGRALFIAGGLSGTEQTFFSSDVKSLVEGGKARTYMHETALMEYPRRTRAWNRKAVGANLVIGAGEYLCYLPFSLFGRKIYVHDPKNNTLSFLYRNNTVLDFLFVVFAVLPTLAATSAMIAVFLLKRPYYRRLFERQMAEDREFCRARDEA